MELVLCRCNECDYLFIIEIPEDINQMFIDETEKDELLGGAECPSCNKIFRLIDCAQSDGAGDEWREKGKWIR